VFLAEPPAALHALKTLVGSGNRPMHTARLHMRGAAPCPRARDTVGPCEQLAIELRLDIRLKLLEYILEQQHILFVVTNHLLDRRATLRIRSLQDVQPPLARRGDLAPDAEEDAEVIQPIRVEQEVLFRNLLRIDADHRRQRRQAVRDHSTFEELRVVLVPIVRDDDIGLTEHIVECLDDVVIVMGVLGVEFGIIECRNSVDFVLA